VSSNVVPGIINSIYLTYHMHANCASSAPFCAIYDSIFRTQSRYVSFASYLS